RRPGAAERGPGRAERPDRHRPRRHLHERRLRSVPAGRAGPGRHVTRDRSGARPGARRVDHVMGTAVGIDIRDDLPPDDLVSGLEAAFAWLRWVDDTFSTYKAGSQISRIERGELALDDADPTVREVLHQCDILRAFTGGYFDARAAPGGALDPSGLVKGWSVETASALL